LTQLTRTALKKIRTQHPTSRSEFVSAGLSLKEIGEGVFRKTYRISGTSLVVKFPLRDSERDAREGRQHSAAEVRRIKKLSGVPVIKGYLPKVYYHDKKSGTVVMSYHKKFNNQEAQFEKLGELTTRLIRRLTGVTVGDIHGGNVNVKDNAPKKPSLVFIDLGY
jgi:hypothetical protein